DADGTNAGGSAIAYKLAGNTSAPPPACVPAATPPNAADLNGLTFATIVQGNHSVVLSSISATPANVGDTVNPYVSSVAHVINPNLSPGQLDSTVTGTGANALVITFSETVTYDSTQPPLVVLGLGTPSPTAAAIATAVLTGGNTLTITMASALPVGSTVSVQIPVTAIKDGSGNTLLDRNDVTLLSGGSAAATGSGVCNTTGACPPVTTNTAGTGGIPTGIGYDALNATATADIISLMTFTPVSTTAPAPTVAQVTAQAPTKATDAAFLTTSALTNVFDSTGVTLTTLDKLGDTISAHSPDGKQVLQFNSQAGNTTVPFVTPASDAAANLTCDLEIVRGSGPCSISNVPGSTDRVFTNIARATVTIPVGATDVALSLQRSGQPLDVLFFPVNTGAGLPTLGGSVVSSVAKAASSLGSGHEWFIFAPPAGATLPYSFDVIISGDGGSGLYSVGYVKSICDPHALNGGACLTNTQLTTDVAMPGDSLVAFTRATGGLLGTSAATTLQDYVPPTTGVQLLQQAIAAGAGASTGAGGGVLNTTGSNTGIFLYPVSPQAGNVSYSSGVPYKSDSFVNDFGVSTANGYTSTGDTAYAVGTVGHALTSVLADATSMGTYLGTTLKGITLGVAMSEPVALTATAPAYNGTNASLSAYGVVNQASQKANGLTGPVAGGLPKVNLVTFKVSDLTKLQADARSATPVVLDLTNAVQDLATPANMATAANNANAKVQLVDEFPPLMSRGFFDGTNFVFDFNEPIQLTGNIVFTDAVGTCAAKSMSLAFLNVAPTPAIVLQTGPNGTGTEVVVPASNFRAQPGNAAVAVSDCLGGNVASPLPAYAESAYTAASLGSATVLPAAAISPTPTHGGAQYYNVPDTANNTALGLPNGNTWATTTGAAAPGNWANTGLGLQNPLFAVANILGPFQLVTAPGVPFCTGLTAASSTVTCTVTLSHPLLIAAQFAGQKDFDLEPLPAPSGGALTPSQILSYLCGDNSVTAAGSNANGTAGKFSLLKPLGGGTYGLRARCNSATLTNGAGVQVFNNTATTITLGFNTLNAAGCAAAPCSQGQQPASGDVFWMAPAGGSDVLENATTVVLTVPAAGNFGPHLSSAFIPTGVAPPAPETFVIGATPSSNGAIGDNDSKASPVPAFEMIQQATP
ncbi:MAG: hypothetical protein ACRETE_03130, partial [Stenotrophobium sp.]